MQIFLLFCTKKSTFFMLHTHFYKTPTSVCLLYTFFYLNNIILNFFYYSQLYPGLTNFNTHAISDLYLFLFLFHFLLLFFFSFSFFLLLHFFFFSVFVFLLLLLKRENSSWVSFFLHFLLVLLQFRFDYLYGFDGFFL